MLLSTYYWTHPNTSEKAFHLVLLMLLHDFLIYPGIVYSGSSSEQIFGIIPANLFKNNKSRPLSRKNFQLLKITEFGSQELLGSRSTTSKNADDCFYSVTCMVKTLAIVPEYKN